MKKYSRYILVGLLALSTLNFVGVKEVKAQEIVEPMYKIPMTITHIERESYHRGAKYWIVHKHSNGHFYEGWMKYNGYSGGLHEYSGTLVLTSSPY